MDGLLSDAIGNALEKLKITKKHPAVNIIGCGGTATSMAALDLNLTSYNPTMNPWFTDKRTFPTAGIRIYQCCSSMEELWSKLIVLPADKFYRNGRFLASVFLKGGEKFCRPVYG